MPLYARFGFVAFGDTYPSAGITHRSMYRPAGG
jgi:predicted GNAT family N-acyltransferase